MSNKMSTGNHAYIYLSVVFSGGEKSRFPAQLIPDNCDWNLKISTNRYLQRLRSRHGYDSQDFLLANKTVAQGDHF